MPGSTDTAHPRRHGVVARGAMYRRAAIDSFLYLDPRNMVRNPVMFVVEVGSVMTTFLFVQAVAGAGEAPAVNESEGDRSWRTRS